MSGEARITLINLAVFGIILLAGFIFTDSLLIGLFAGLACSMASDFFQRRETVS